jgi:flagellar assembly protein FliH
MSTAQALRRPAFLGRVAGGARVQNAAFKPSSTAQFRPPLVSTVAEEPSEDVEADRRAAAAAIAEAQKLAAQFSERTSAAIELLRATSERLAAEARTDALEIGFLVARRILEMELSAGAEPLVNLVRSAVRRLGESRKLTIHLSPSDAQAMNAILEERGTQAVAPASISKVEIVPDPSLGRGDCLVEGDLVTVDGRINARLEELRRVLESGTTEETP